MAVNPDLLIAAPMLQDYFVDKITGTPLSGGIVRLYEDDARQVYKNWYYQTGVPGNYTYVPLDNPLSLSSVGTIMDPNGNDVIPFFYPYDEDNSNVAQPYYITVYSVDSNGLPATLQFTRENFPFVPPSGNAVSTNPTLENYIINGEFWRNIGSADVSSSLSKVIVPDQHDGYITPDITFMKDITGATDNISFITPPTSLTNDVTPEWCLNLNCSAAQIGETLKCIQYPISLHVATLQNQLASLVIHAQNVSGSANNYLDLYIYQFLGTGAIDQTMPFLIQRIFLNSTFQKFVIPFTFPDFSVNTTLMVGNGGDDALFLRVQYPLGVTCNISHAKPQIYLGTQVPNNQFSTYDQINSIISSPRTGDYRMSLNSFSPFGWVALNDGSIGNPSSSATYSNINAWALYSLLWNSVGVTYAPMVDGSPYGASAIIDWNANRAIYLTKTLGRALSSIGQPSTVGGTTWALGQVTGSQTHTLVSTELPDPLTRTADVSSVGSGGIPVIQSNTPYSTGTISNQGGNQPHTIMQPSAFLNVFMKL